MIAQILLSELLSTPKIIREYLKNSPSVNKLFQYQFTLDNIQKLLQNKQKNSENRQIVVKELIKQNSSPTKKQQENLQILQKPNTFTVTTGHQLNLCTGSAFFIYKIIQTIKTTEELNKLQDKNYFVPVFWMATEDHDFAEINHFEYKNQKIEWKTLQNGAVGNFKLDNLLQDLQYFWKLFPNEYWKNTIEQFILQSNTLSEFTRKLINFLFADFGLLIIDANQKELKKLMIPYFKEELLLQTSFQKILETNNYLIDNQYNTQVNPREINLFYIDENGRNRIVKSNSNYQILHTNKCFSEREILNELEEFPERFSPNVLLRPLYQEVILPNIAYIGGNAEISYWLQLKNYFHSQNVQFPILIPRNSVIVLNEKAVQRIKKSTISFEDIFLPKNEIINKKVLENSEVIIDFDELEDNIGNIYSQLREQAKKTDITFLNLVNAQQHKQLKAFEKLKKRLVRAQRRKNSEKVQRIENIFEDIFPNNIAQERVKNIFELSEGNLSDFIQNIYKDINVFQPICFSTVFDK